MKINVSGRNEYKLYPDISGNKELSQEKRFAIVLRRLNATLHSHRWASFGADGKISISLGEKIREHIIRIDNPPTLSIDGGKKERPLVVDDLVSDEFPELVSITTEIVNFINDLEGRGELETKKS